MTTVPTVSCIVPTRDRAALLCGAIDSARAQTCSVEILVVDDGSSDGTVDALACYGDAVRLVPSHGRGPAAARNTGILAASGEFVAFLDSDDLWHPDKVKTQLALMRARPELGFTYTDYTVSQLVDGDRVVTQTRRHDDEPTLAALCERNFTCTSTVMARRSIVQSLGGFDDTLERGSDYHLWLRIAAGHPFGRVQSVLADYLWHEASITHMSRERNRQAGRDVLARLASSNPTAFDVGVSGTTP